MRIPAPRWLRRWWDLQRRSSPRSWCFRRYGHVGIAGAIAISGWVGALLLGILVGRRGWLALDAAARQRLIRIAFAAVIMGIAVFLARHVLGALPGMTESALAQITTLGVLVAGGLAIYLALLHAFGIVGLRQLAVTIRKGI